MGISFFSFSTLNTPSCIFMLCFLSSPAHANLQALAEQWVADVAEIVLALRATWWPAQIAAEEVSDSAMTKALSKRLLATAKNPTPWLSMTASASAAPPVEVYQEMEHFFEAIATLMSVQLRNFVSDSLEAFLSLLRPYTKGSTYEGAYDDTHIEERPLLSVRLVVEQDGIVFSPPLTKIERVLTDLCSVIAKVWF